MAKQYAQSALNGFARAVAHMHGVPIAFEAGAPRTDGSTVYLPPISAQTIEEFESFCGIALHEVAHVKFKTPSRLRLYAKRRNHDPFASEAFNAVVDVADETRLEVLDPCSPSRAAVLFARATCSCWQKSVAERIFEPGQAPVHWQVLTIASYLVRFPPGQPLKLCQHIAKRLAVPGNVIHAARRILKQAVTRRNTRCTKRSSACWRRLERLADELLALLDPYRPQDSAASRGIGERLRSDMLSINRRLAPGDSLADEYDGADIATGGTTAAAACGTGGKLTWFDSRLFRKLAPIFQNVAQQLAELDTAVRVVKGHANGTVLCEPIRSRTDGRCFGRRSPVHAQRAAVALLLDTSGSMASQLPSCAATAKAFAKAMRPVGAVRCWSFNSVSNEVAVEQFDCLAPEGGTMTGRAMELARLWLLSCGEGSRLLIVITDGAPQDPVDTARLCRTCSSEDTRVIAMGLSSCAAQLRKTMPSAWVCSIDRPALLSLQLLQVITRCRQ